MHRIVVVAWFASSLLACSGARPASKHASTAGPPTPESRDSCDHLRREGARAELWVAPRGALAFQVDGDGRAVQLSADLSMMRELRQRHPDRPLLVLAIRSHGSPQATPEEVEAAARLASEAGWNVTTVCRTPLPEPPRGTTPTRGEVITAINGVARAVNACSPGFGALQARLVFRSDGSLDSVSSPDQTLDPVLDQCVRDALQPMRVQAFQQETFVVNYPFRL